MIAVVLEDVERPSKHLVLERGETNVTIFVQQNITRIEITTEKNLNIFSLYSMTFVLIHGVIVMVGFNRNRSLGSIEPNMLLSAKVLQRRKLDNEKAKAVCTS